MPVVCTIPVPRSTGKSAENWAIHRRVDACSAAAVRWVLVSSVRMRGAEGAVFLKMPGIEEILLQIPPNIDSFYCGKEWKSGSNWKQAMQKTQKIRKVDP